MYWCCTLLVQQVVSAHQVLAQRGFCSCSCSLCGGCHVAVTTLQCCIKPHTTGDNAYHGCIACLHVCAAGYWSYQTANSCIFVPLHEAGIWMTHLGNRQPCPKSHGLSIRQDPLYMTLKDVQFLILACHSCPLLLLSCSRLMWEATGIKFGPAVTSSV